jgi:protein-S-isoprenylcysteine O-methyltransferase Ste14
LKIPPVVVGACAGLLVWAGGAVPILSWTVSAMLEGLAALLGVIGILVTVAGVAAFYKARTTVNPHTPGKASLLVTRGIYAYSRNPMYAGLFALLLGWAVLQGGLLPLLLALVFIPFMTRFQIVPEERVLRTLFGEDFERYQARVRRWI